MADLINIKLMKTGGITGALRVNAVAQAGGINVMVGCMSESIVSVAAGVHFACSRRNIVYADLDSHFDVDRDVAKGGATFHDGYLYPLDRPGFGLNVGEALLEDLAEAGASSVAAKGRWLWMGDLTLPAPATTQRRRGRVSSLGQRFSLRPPSPAVR